MEPSSPIAPSSGTATSSRQGADQPLPNTGAASGFGSRKTSSLGVASPKKQQMSMFYEAVRAYYFAAYFFPGVLSIVNKAYSKQCILDFLHISIGQDNPFGATLWNALPAPVRLCDEIDSFKLEINKLFL